ncbi:hypothetical protein M5W27_16115 [Bacillus xiamenensis]|uniref:Uncharacterized protein n=1 Tax=Bacillus xiamenensis TaxID=1178537 RepID=A0ABT4F5H6_9BACI|nr:hypothetical protein [Bacillus xiamenensis]MCY9577304.1 hypothetical protein [Bacillus xiamenensis]
MKNHAKVKNHAKAKKVNRKNHAAANTNLIIRKAAASHIAVIDQNDLITTNVVILAEDAERKNIILAVEVEGMSIVNGIKEICGNIDATAKYQIFIFETLFKREYDKKGFFYFIEK